MRKENRSPYHGIERSAPSKNVTPQALQAAKCQIYDKCLNWFETYMDIYEKEELEERLTFLNSMFITDSDWLPYIQKITLLINRRKLLDVQQMKECEQSQAKALEKAADLPRNINVDGDLVMNQNNNTIKRRKKR